MPSVKNYPNSALRYLDQYKAVGLAFVLVLTAFCYSNIFGNSFVCDDLAFIVNWPLIRDLGNFPQFFGAENQPETEHGVYSPLKTLVHALSYHSFGLDPFGYHVVSLLIHLFGTALVFFIAYELTGKGGIAFLSALVFGVHPAQTEAITFLTASVDTLGIVFMFASFYFLIKLHKENRAVHYWLSIVFSILAIFTHELAVTLPFLFLWYVFCFHPKRRLDHLWPYFATAAVYVFLKWNVLGDIARGHYLMESFVLTALVTLKALLRYLQVLIWPMHLPLNPELSPGIYAVDIHWFDRDKVWAQSFNDPQVLASIAMILIAVAVCIHSYQRNKTVLFSVGWFYVSLLPVMNIIPSESYFGIRYLYPGMLGVSLLVAVGLDQIFAKGPAKVSWAAAGLFGAFIIFLMAATFGRNADWKSNISFYEAEVRETPNNPHLRIDLALLYREAGDITKALRTIEEAAALRTPDREMLFVLGQIRQEAGDLPGAITAYQSAVSLDAKFAFAYFNLANALWVDGKKEESKAALAEAVGLFRESGDKEWLKIAEEIFQSNFP